MPESFVFEFDLSLALLAILGMASTVFVAVVKKVTPETLRSRWVVLGVTAALAIVSTLIAVATGQVPTPWAEQVAQVIVHFAVILSIGQSLYRVFKDKLDGIAGLPPVVPARRATMTGD